MYEHLCVEMPDAHQMRKVLVQAFVIKEWENESAVCCTRVSYWQAICKSYV